MLVGAGNGEVVMLCCDGCGVVMLYLWWCGSCGGVVAVVVW